MSPSASVAANSHESLQSSSKHISVPCSGDAARCQSASDVWKMNACRQCVLDCGDFRCAGPAFCVCLWIFKMFMKLGCTTAFSPQISQFLMIFVAQHISSMILLQHLFEKQLLRESKKQRDFTSTDSLPK